ncbi:hypothetical protein EAG_08159, partial [Camponotus floridanus]
REAMNGGFMIEVAGSDKDAKADLLASKLREVVNREGVKISRPVMMAELRVRDIDRSISIGEIQDALANIGQCNPMAIQVGTIRRVPNGLGTLWVKCPLVSANKMTTAGRVKIGWTSLRVERLIERPLQCFKCLEGDHVAQRCPNKTDHSGRCYRYGEEGHISRTC